MDGRKWVHVNRKDIPGNSSGKQISNFGSLVLGKKFTLSRLVEFIDFYGPLIKSFLKQLPKIEAPDS